MDDGWYLRVITYAIMKCTCVLSAVRLNVRMNRLLSCWAGLLKVEETIKDEGVVQIPAVGDARCGWGKDLLIPGRVIDDKTRGGWGTLRRGWGPRISEGHD